MSGLNFSTLHEELITSNFKTSLFGVCFQFGRFMTLNYFYTELAEFPLSYYLWYKNSHILPHHTAQRSSWLHQEMWPSSESLFCPSTPYKGSEGCSLPPYLKVFSKEGWGWTATRFGFGWYNLMNQKNLPQAPNNWGMDSLSRSPLSG